MLASILPEYESSDIRVVACNSFINLRLFQDYQPADLKGKDLRAIGYGVKKEVDVQKDMFDNALICQWNSLKIRHD